MESLYRKYRPQTFETMVGQKHIVSTLENALNEGRTAHAYLFSGPRGTGKTTTARLLAKALLCEHGPTAHPDGTCEQCEAIAEGTHPDVYELDAASRTGVDNVREEIINRVAFAPTQGRSKVYIIDEVHMLTTAAFNALLKTLEEPPGHVVFVLCTTDPQKVPETILSRCQRLEFHRITTSDIEDRLRYVCENEGFSYDPEALALVAKHARGGLRDALSMLEQLSVFGGRSVKLADAQSVLGEVSDDVLADLVRKVAARDVAACFAQVADLADRGADMAQFTRDLTRYVRNAYVVAVAGPQAAEGGSGESLAALAGDLGGPDRIAYLLDLLGRLESEMRTSLDQRLSLEVTLTRMARPQSDLTLESLSARVADLERELADLRAHGVPTGAGAPAAAAVAEKPAAFGAPAPVAERPVQPARAAAAPAPASAPAPAMSAAALGASIRPGAPGAPASRPAQGVPPRQGAAAQGSFAPRPAYGAAPTAPAVQPAAQPQATPAVAPTGIPAPAAAAPAVPQTSMDPGMAQRLWGRVVDMVIRTNPSVGALLRNADGFLADDGTLTVVNRGASFAAQMLSRPASIEVVGRVASEVYGRPVRVALAGTGAAGSAPHAAPRPAPAANPAAAAAHQTAARPAPPTPSGQRPDAPAAQFGVPAVGHATPTAAPAAAPTAPVPAAAPARASVPNAAALAAAAAAAAARADGRPAPAPAGPAPAAGSASPQGFSAPAPQGDAPAYEFVPDDVYDTYAPDVDEGFAGSPAMTPPWEEAPAVSAASAPAAAPTGRPVAPAASQPVSPVAVPAQPAGTQPADEPAYSAPDDQAAIELAQMLSAAFGGFVKISRE